MQVLNTYIASDAEGISGQILLSVIGILIVAAICLLKDDITRFLEHHTIGASFYTYMQHVWKLLIGIVFVVIFIISIAFTPTQKHIYVEATILPNYPIGPLYEKYEIIEKRGEIWVLEQRPSWVEEVVSSDKEEE